MEYRVRTGSRRHKLFLDGKDDFSQETAVEVGKNTYRVKIHERVGSGEARLISVNNRLLWVKVERRDDGFPRKVILNGTAYPVEIERVASTRYRPPVAERKGDGRVTAPLPGQIAQLFVGPGERVKAGQPLLVLEAMKMENEVTAPRDGVIHTVLVGPRQLVTKGELLVEIVEG